MEQPTAWRKNGGLRREKTAKLLGEEKIVGDMYPRKVDALIFVGDPTCLTIM